MTTNHARMNDCRKYAFELMFCSFLSPVDRGPNSPITVISPVRVHAKLGDYLS